MYSRSIRFWLLKFSEKGVILFINLDDEGLSCMYLGASVW